MLHEVRLAVLRRERAEFLSTLRDVGLDAPTLCGDWTAGDLGAHLALQEVGRGVPLLVLYTSVVLPAIAAGIGLGGVERVRNSRVQRWAYQLRDRDSDWLARLEHGPPRVFALRGVASVRLMENYVHHEDLRRAQPGWTPRALIRDAEKLLRGALWWLGRYHRRSLRGITVELVDERGLRTRVSSGQCVATITGTVGELVLYLAGRRNVAQVQIAGAGAAVIAARSISL